MERPFLDDGVFDDGEPIEPTFLAETLRLRYEAARLLTGRFWLLALAGVAAGLGMMMELSILSCLGWLYTALVCRSLSKVYEQMRCSSVELVFHSEAIVYVDCYDHAVDLARRAGLLRQFHAGLFWVACCLFFYSATVSWNKFAAGACVLAAFYVVVMRLGPSYTRISSVNFRLAMRELGRDSGSASL
jgi:hypothetical protein